MFRKHDEQYDKLRTNPACSCIFILLPRESDQSVVTSSLRSCEPFCLPHQDGGIPQSAFPNCTTSKLTGLFFVLTRLQIKAESTALEADALTTRPSELLNTCNEPHVLHWQKFVLIACQASMQNSIYKEVAAFLFKIRHHSAISKLLVLRPLLLLSLVAY